MQSQSSSFKSQQTDRAFKWEVQFLANDKSCFTQWIAQKNMSAFMPLKMSLFLRKKKSVITSMLCYYLNKPSVRNQWKYSCVSSHMETMEPHPDAIISADVVMDNGAKIPPTITWKNKMIKVSLNTTQGCTTLHFTGIFASGFISAAVWEKSQKKDQTYNRQRLLRV